MENKNIEDKIIEHTEKLSQQIKVVETGLQKKADTTELEKLQKRVEEFEDKYEKVPENSQEGKTWTEIMDISEKRTVEEVIEKSLKNRESEEKDRQNRRKNIIIFRLSESKKTASEDRKEEDTRKFTGVCKNILKVNITEDSLEKIIRLGKITEDKDRQLLITLKEETKKREIFQNLNKLREVGSPLENVIIVHDLTPKQKEELKEKIEEAREKENKDWSWYIKKSKNRSSKK